MLSDADRALIAGMLGGDRRKLARMITLLESTHPDHQRRAHAILNELLPRTGGSIRVGISGSPGAGKSTFIEALGLVLLERGHRVAVLAVDPSSTRSGGSILGDKTRMERLSTSEAAFVRPSPSSGALGGVAERTRETILVCESAGFDVVLVETVGVGQSEIAVADMTDVFVLLQLPNAGDDVQAMKKGVMELADIVVVNKCDLDPTSASRTARQIVSALHAARAASGASSGRALSSARVLQASALDGTGVADVWEYLSELHAALDADGRLEERRRRQALAWMWERVRHTLLHDFERHPAVKAALPELTRAVAEARMAPPLAARTLLELFSR